MKNLIYGNSTNGVGMDVMKEAFMKANYTKGTFSDVSLPVSNPIRVIVKPKVVANPTTANVPIAKVKEGESGKEYYIEAGTAMKSTVLTKITSTPTVNKSDIELTHAYKCTECGTPFNMTIEYEQWFIGKGLEIPKRCSSCRKKKAAAEFPSTSAICSGNAEATNFHNCIDCGNVFFISESHEQWFKNMDLLLPNRCPRCIKKRKAAKSAQ